MGSNVYGSLSRPLTVEDREKLLKLLEKTTVLRTTSTPSGALVGLPCDVCRQQIRRGQKVCYEEHNGYYLNESRYKVWHVACHPDYDVDRDLEKLRKAIERAHGWWGHWDRLKK